MQTIEELERALAKLKAEKAKEEKLREKEARAIWDAFQSEWEYSVKWLDDFYLRISCKRTEACLAEIERILAEYGPHTWGLYDAPDKTFSMEHMLVGGYLIAHGGGSIITTVAQSSSFRRPPEKLAEEEIAQLWAGVVPERLKAPWK